MATALICRTCQPKPQAPVVPPDTQKYERKADSALNLMKRYRDSSRILQQEVKDLHAQLQRGHNTVKHEKEKIKNFTPDARLAWNDSVLRANGLR